MLYINKITNIRGNKEYDEWLEMPDELHDDALGP
jgi:hypothetical protein